MDKTTVHMMSWYARLLCILGTSSYTEYTDMNIKRRKHC